MSWIARYLAPFKEPKMHNDPMQSGAGAGEPLHPDQDNAPAVSGPGAHLTGTAGDRLRVAVAEIYPGDPHKRAWGEELVPEVNDAEARGWPLQIFLEEELEEVGDDKTPYADFIRNLYAYFPNPRST